MSISKELLQFRAGVPDEIVDRMHAMAVARTGKEWLNLQPWVDQDLMPKTSILRHLFSARGYAVPTSTWVPGHPGAKPPDVTQVGIQHGAGHHARQLLVEAGHGPPERWQPTQDHTRRGLVFELPPGETPLVALDYIVAATSVLAAELPIDDRWVAGFVTQD